VRIELPASGGTLVKTIGDALMLRVPDPRAAVPLALQMAHDVMRGHGAPAVRVGLHHGPAAERDGDYFGASVNLAARVSAVATAGEVVMTAHTAALAPALDGVIYEARGRQQFRNVSEPVELVAAVRFAQTANSRLTVDPVCQMTVDPDQASGRLDFQDVTYFFCTLACAGAFAQHPERYARSTQATPTAQSSRLTSDRAV
jgi:adenylate cyclase